MTVFESDIVLGKNYRDKHTGIKGTATGCTFYLNGCERVMLEYVKEKELKYESFDAPRLLELNTEGKVVAEVSMQPGHTGGPGAWPSKRS